MCGIFDGADYSHVNGKLRDSGKSYLVNIKIVLFLRNYCIYPNICLSVLMPTHCTIMRFRFHTRQIDSVKCGLFSNHALLGQTTLRVEIVSVQCYRKLRLG